MAPMNPQSIGHFACLLLIGDLNISRWMPAIEEIHPRFCSVYGVFRYSKVNMSHRIHGAAIYGNIYHQYTPNVSIYTSTMDPMGVGKYSLPLSMS